MRKIIPFIMVIFLFIPLTYAATVTATATVTITIINNLPEIISINSDKSIVYPDSELTCTPVINDEVPDKVILHYKWYVNDKLTKEQSNVFDAGKYNVNGKDVVKCSIVPEDVAHQYGGEVSAEEKISSSPITAIIIRDSLNLVGKNINTEQAIEIQNKLFS